MPHLPLRPCTQPGCSELSANGRCPKHQRKDTRPFYAKRKGVSRDWPAVSRAVLKRDPVCTIRTHCTGAPSTDAAHIDPAGPDIAMNARGACHRCHSAETASRDGGFGNPVRHSAPTTLRPTVHAP